MSVLQSRWCTDNRGGAHAARLVLIAHTWPNLVSGAVEDYKKFHYVREGESCYNTLG